MRMTESPRSDLGFWHPVGPHGRESLAEICARKVRNTGEHGFTLWSFAAARPERVFAWRDELLRHGITSCEAVCCGDASEDPSRSKADVRWATEYSADLRT